MGQKVLPVFYDVEPSEVRGQKRSFQTAFEQHEVKFIDDMDKVNSWREALKSTANLSGWDVPTTASGHEAECIKQIVRNILRCIECHPAENLIGMESHIRHMKSLLGKMSTDVCIIGIWGMGGIGKTTIARAVYRQISYEFEGTCFVEDVRENGSDKKGLKSLQEKLLSEILMQESFKVKDCDDGISQIRRRLGRKKVLVVLDDVDNVKQLEFLAGSHEWFGPGSRIIITTRDEHLLCYAQEKYAPNLLKETEAVNLFSRYAFKANIPPITFQGLSHAVVAHTGHLPLALKVLGSHFCGRNLDFWQSALNVLANIPHNEINAVLKLSYDGLNNIEKRLFLDIACFFKGKERRHAMRILDSFGFEAVTGITVVIEKSLLTIPNGYFHMHDLIQDMGRFIVRECYPNTMLWVPEEIKEVMTAIGRLETVEAIVVRENDYLSDRSTAYYSTEVFKSMKKLRLLQVEEKFTTSEPTYFPEELKWLCWSEYPFQFLRITRGMIKLVGLKMKNSLMGQLRIEQVILPNLKFINLHNSRLITMFPDISGVPNLEWLNLSCCLRLVEVHQSVLLHERIIYLNLSYCHKLDIPPSCIEMKSLQTLLLNECFSLKRFPEVSTKMGRLSLLYLHACNKIGVLPPSIRLLTGLTTLSIGRSYGVGFEQVVEQGYSRRILGKLRVQASMYLSSLRVLNLENNNLVDDDFPGNLHNAWPSLEELNLSRNHITCLASSISQLPHLKHLNVRECINLKELHELPTLIQYLRADACRSLQKIGDLLNKYKWLFKISVIDCPKLRMDEESQSHLANLLLKSLVQKCAAVNHRLSIAVPGIKIPKWFSNQQLGNKIALKVPQNQISNLIGLAICCRVPALRTSFRITFKLSCEGEVIGRPIHTTKRADLLWIGYMSIDFLGNLCHGFESDDLILSVDSGLNNPVECGVCMVYKDDIMPIAGNGSWISDYDELGRIDHYSASSEDLQHGRWSLPTFSINYEKSGERKSVTVFLA